MNHTNSVYLIRDLVKEIGRVLHPISAVGSQIHYKYCRWCFIVAIQAIDRDF